MTFAVIWITVACFALFFVPGALVYRLPIAGRDRRAGLAVEERLFWYVILSVAWSLSIALALAALDAYTIARLVGVNGAVSAAILAGWRGRLLLGRSAARPTWTILLAAALVALGAWRFFPPSEYVIGGKDPGTYMNEGFQIAKRGSILIADETAAAVPASLNDLFFTSHRNPYYFDNRFMGFFLRDPATGETVGQFPHLYPASIAIAYGVAALDGAQLVTGLWAILGLCAVYVAGRRLVGPAPAFAAATLLALNVLQVWWARYPNAEIAMQPLVFAGLLGFARAHQDADAFFAPIAGWLIALLAFLRIETIVVVGGLACAAILMWLVERKPLRRSFLIPLTAGGALAVWYYTGPLAAYLAQPVLYLQSVPASRIVVAILVAAAACGALLWLRRRVDERARTAVPWVLAIVVITLAGYAWLLRHPGGKLTDYDAYALRTFTRAYFLWPALVAALVGFVLVVRRDFWRDPGLILAFTVFAVFLCYKVWIVPTHFWMGRRLVPVVLPGLLLFASAAALGGYVGRGTIARSAFRLVGLVFLIVLGRQYIGVAAPVVRHVEYAGLIGYLDALAARFSDRDLVIVESRDSGSDTHVMALPLAYLYDKRVLVLESPTPDKQVLEAFLAHALRHYAHVFFVGGGGTNLLSRRIRAAPIADARVHLPEYEVAPWHSFPDEVHRKDFDYSVYELTLGSPSNSPFVLDVGFQDDLNVVRFHAKEESGGRTVRWTGAQSFVFVPGLTGGERTISFVMHDGGRPRTAAPAAVEVLFGEEPLGTIAVGAGFETYTLDLPADAVRRAAARDEPAQIVLRSSVWIPRDLIGGDDDRSLGVMIDRVEVR